MKTDENKGSRNEPGVDARRLNRPKAMNEPDAAAWNHLSRDQISTRKLASQTHVKNEAYPKIGKDPASSRV